MVEALKITNSKERGENQTFTPSSETVDMMTLVFILEAKRLRQ